MAFTFLANALNQDLAERICMESTMNVFKDVLNEIPEAAENKVDEYWAAIDRKESEQEFIERYGDIKNDDRYEELVSRLVELNDIVERDDDDDESPTFFYTIMDSLEGEFGDITIFLDFIRDEIEIMDDAYWDEIDRKESEQEFIERYGDIKNDDRYEEFVSRFNDLTDSTETNEYSTFSETIMDRKLVLNLLVVMVEREQFK